MECQDLFKSSIISACSNRSYLQEKWIGDKLLVTILQNNHHLGEFVNKRFLIRYLPNLSLNYHKCCNVRINNIIKTDKTRTNVIFCHFSRYTIILKHMST